MENEKVFISYVRENEEQVLRVCEHLKKNNISYWIDKEQLLPGDIWASSIFNAIKNGAFFIVFFSKESEAKDKSFMREEIDTAIKASKLLPPSKKWLIPVKLSECEIPEYQLSNGKLLNQIQYVELFKNWEIGIESIIKSILSNNSSSNNILMNRDNVDDLVGAYLHDMNNLLTAITGYHMLQSMKFKNEYTDRMDLSIDRCNKLFHDLFKLIKRNMDSQGRS